jgi:hypothetical protein
MMHAQIYPPADHTTQWAQANFARGAFTTVEKLLLHSTETGGFPSYGTGCAEAPTLTYHPILRKFRQHNEIGSSARALEDPSTTVVRENRDNVVQVEIVAYADTALAASRGGLAIHNLSDGALDDLGALAGWLHLEWGLPLQSTVDWKDYPGSAGADNGVRLTGPQYDAYRGLLGHEHATGNHHGDPGHINVARILLAANAYVTRATGSTVPSRTHTRPPIVAPAKPEIVVANVRPGRRNEDCRKFNALLWANCGAVYRKAMQSRWMSESADLYGPVAQQVCLDKYRYLHATHPATFTYVPSAPAWPGRVLVEYLGGIAR